MNYMNYFGADATPLMNFYAAQKQQEMLKNCEAHAKEVINQHNKMVSQSKIKLIAETSIEIEEIPMKPIVRLEDEPEFKKFEETLVPCDLHPLKPSNNCRKCKKTKQSRIKKLNDMLKERRERHPEFMYISNEITIIESAPKKPIEEDSIIPGVFQTYGDPVACNMNDLLRTNILNTQYYRELQDLTTCEEIMGQIEYYCKHAEPFTLGTNNVPSTLFCCLYKLLMMKLTEGQIMLLLNSNNPYVKATGSLYIRFVGRPEELWRRLGRHLLDEEIFAPSADAENKMTFGEFIEKLLTDLNYYGTRLPRLPILIEKDIRKKVALVPKKRERAKFNKENYNLFSEGAECYCLSNKDYNWYHGTVKKPDPDIKFVKASVLPDEGETWEENLDLGSIILVSCIQTDTNDEEEKKSNDDNMAKNNEVSEKKSEESSKHKKRSRHRSRSHSRHRSHKHSRHHRHKHKHKRDRSRSHKRSYSRDNSRSRSKSRSRSRSRKRKDKKSHKRDHRKRDRSRSKNSESYNKDSRSHSKDTRKRDKEKKDNYNESKEAIVEERDNIMEEHNPINVEAAPLESNQDILSKLNDENKKLIEDAFENERDQILASTKSEYARRPTSYKSALSLTLPVGTVRKKSKSASPQRKVIEIKLVSTQRKTKTEELEEKVSKMGKQESAEHYERMRKIQEKYGEATALKGKKVKEISGDDHVGPEIVKFGIKK